MVNALIGIKQNMSSSYDSRGRRVGVTRILVEPNIITQIKNDETKDGYTAVQVGIGTRRNLRKPQLGHLKKANIEKPTRTMREVTVDDTSDLEPGKQIQVSQVFSVGDIVKITGTSKGKGFQGGVKRYGFAGGPKTHGQSDRHRAPGSIGSGTTPGRVYKGKHMAGHMGVDTVSVRNLEVVSIDKKNNTLVVKGGVPGATGAILTILKLGRVKGYIAPPEEKIDEEETPSDVEQMSGVVEQPAEEKVQAAETETIAEVAAPAEEVAPTEAAPVEDIVPAEEVKTEDVAPEAAEGEANA